MNFRFGHKAKLFSDFEHKVWSRFWCWSAGDILKLKFGQNFAADVWLRLQSWILVKIMKLGLVNILSLILVEMLMFGWDFKVNALSRFWNWSLIKICDMNSTLWSVVPLAMFYHWHKNTAFTIHCYRGSFYNFCNIGSFKCYNVALAVINEWLSKNKFELFVKGSWRRQWISSTWSPSAHFISPSYSRASRTSRSLARPARWSDWWVVLCLVLIKIIHDWCLTVSYMINDRGQFDHYWPFS